MNDLASAARHWGVEPGYHDIFGHWQDVPEATLRKLVAAVSQGRQEPYRAATPPVERAFQGDGARVWGLAVQLYAVRSRRNWGIGDFADLRGIIDIAAKAGASAVGVNPLHALFLDRPDMASPYGPNSRRFLNPLYIAVDEIEEFAGASAPFTGGLEALRQVDLVDYPRVAALKLAALRVAYEKFSSNASPQRAAAFKRFRREQGEALKRFACFEILRARQGGTPWWQWPPPWSNPDAAAIDRLQRSESHECGFVEFLQWTADQQLGLCRQAATDRKLGIGLYLDLAVGVDRAGADAWSNQNAVLAGFSIGAPPDEFNRTGQNWGLAPFNPHALPDHDFALMREQLASAMRHAGAVRLDHVLGLMRLYLIPNGAGGAEGAYVHYPFEQLLRVVADESNKHRCIFIGEDLGTVPDGFREIAAKWGVWSYRVMMFERGHDGEFKPPSDYPPDALAAFNTHDLPTFRGWITAHDLQAKRAIGLDPGENDEARRHSRDALRRILSGYAGPDGADHFAAAAGFLAATPARLVVVAIEDLLEGCDQINVPGTVREYPNWRRKLPVSLEQWTSQPVFEASVAAFDRAGRGAAR